MNVTCQEAIAKIALNKSLLKEYSTKDYPRVVYLNNDSEFQIQLFNSYTNVIGVKIFLDGESLEDTLVLRPAERIWLERFFNKSKKFKFSTYEIENSDVCRTIENAAKNGEVKLEFYNVKPKRNNPIQIVTTSSYPWNGVYYNTSCGSSDCHIKGISSEVNSISTSCYNAKLDCLDCCEDKLSFATQDAVSTSSMETGRINEGSYSTQQFTYVDYDFESYPFKTEVIRILPSSRKAIESSDLRKRYCTNCGKKLSPKVKYCPNCGTKVE